MSLRKSLAALLLTTLAGFSPSAFADDVARLEIYDVADLLQLRREYPAPEGFPEVRPPQEVDANTLVLPVSDLVERIKSVVAPSAWDLPQNTIQGKKGSLFVNASNEIHAQLVAYLGELRMSSPWLFVTTIQIYPVTDADLEELGFDLSVSRRAYTISSELVENWTQRRVEVPVTTRMATFEGQRSHVMSLRQQAFVGDVNRDPQDGSLSPVVETCQEGFLFEITVQRRAGSLLLTWKHSVAAVAEPRALEQISPVLAVELPETHVETVAGKSFLRQGQALVIRTSGIEAFEGECIAVLTVSSDGVQSR